MEIIKVKGNTYCIDTGMTYLPFYKLNDQDIIMMDSGYRDEVKGIEALLEENNFKIKAIICSHAHPDHVGNNSYFKEKYACKIAMTREEAVLTSSYSSIKAFYDQPMHVIKNYYDYLVCETDIIIDDNQDSVILNDAVFKLFHTHGHSPNQICIITPDDVAYLADTLITHDVMAGTKIPYAFVLADDLKSKERLLQLNNSSYIVAHKGILNDVKGLIQENIQYYSGMADRIYEIIIVPMTFEEIIKRVIRKLKIEVKTVYKYRAVERILKSYMEYLYEIGRVEMIVDEDLIKYVKTN